MLRHPNDWPDAQRAFRAAIESGSHIAPERAVIAVWWRPATARRGEVMIACYDPADMSGEQPLVVFPADAPYPAEEGTSLAQLIGEVGLNAACCLRLHGSLVWPSYNPVTHVSHAPPHDRPPGDLRGRTWVAATAVVVVVALAASLLGYLVFPDPRFVVLIAVPALVVGAASRHVASKEAPAQSKRRVPSPASAEHIAVDLYPLPTGRTLPDTALVPRASGRHSGRPLPNPTLGRSRKIKGAGCAGTCARPAGGASSAVLDRASAWVTASERQVPLDQALARAFGGRLQHETPTGKGAS